jgi:flagellar motor switch protein FliM
VVSIGIEVRIGESVGMMNIALPSIVIKMMRQKSDQQWSVRKTHASEAEQARVLRILRQATLTMEARLEGPTLTVEELLGRREGHVLVFDLCVTGPVELTVNRARKFTAQVIPQAKIRVCQVEKTRPLPGQGSTSDEPGSASVGGSISA